MTNSDPKTAAIFAAMAKFDEVIRDYNEANRLENEAKVIAARAAELKNSSLNQYRGLSEMADLFGFDLNGEHKSYLLRNSELAPQLSNDWQFSNPIDVVKLMFDRPKTIKEHAIEAARQAYPNPIRASTLRRQLEGLGIMTHEKTVGMTLYRLLRDKVLQRRGWDWYFVPEAERSTTAEPQGEGSPDEPGLLLSAAAE